MTSGPDEHQVSGTGAGRENGPEDQQPVVKDRRRIDPETGQVRATAAGAGAGQAPAAAPEAGPAPGGPAPADGELVASLRQQVQERTADLQRLKAEFDNYRRRVERDRQAAADQATAKLLTSLLGVLDDIGRARDHGDLEGPFKAIAESLESTLEAAGLERFGTPGDEFDPRLHDALMHSYRSDVTRPTCVEVFRAGYRRGNQILRAAQVAVAEPSGEVETPPPAEQAGQAGQTGQAEQADHGISDRVTDIGAGRGGEGGAGPVPDDTGSIPGPDRGGPTVSAD